ncbi:MAG: glycine cleavage system protein R [Halieaceae bacterium]|jgi:glycine cleavage system regulatory protein|nr:glycine cleavage system protein R [Halieaceae bacterium]
METFYIITFIGDDRPGLVEQVARVIEDNSGNWHDSQLSQLGGKFAGLILISLPVDSGTALEQALKGLSKSGLSMRVTPTSSGHALTSSHEISLSVIGPDRPGIVREISQAMASQDINVVSLESQICSAPMSGEMLFEASIRAQIPQDTNLDQLSDRLDDIANEMTLDIGLDSA